MFIDEIRVTLERAPDPLPLGLGQVVIEKCGGPSDGIEKMGGGQVDIRQVVGIAPRLIVECSEDPSPRRVERLRFLLDRIRKTHFGDRVRNRILGSPLLRSGRLGRTALERRQVGDYARPLLAMRRARAHSQSLELFLGDKDSRMNSFELRLQMNRRREQAGECGRLVAAGGDAREYGYETQSDDSHHEKAPVDLRVAGKTRPMLIRRIGYLMYRPPEMSIVSPARYALSSLARKAITLATSSGVPARPSGIVLTTFSKACAGVKR